MKLAVLAAIALAIAPQLARAQDAPSPTPEASPAIDPRLLGGPATAHAESHGSFLDNGPLAPPPERLTRGRVAAMVAVPASCVAIGGTAWAGLANQTGDAGTPALEMGAGFAGSWAATGLFAAGVLVADRDVMKPAALRRFSDSPWTIAVTSALVPLGAAAGAAGSGELLEGGSKRPWEAFGGAAGGAVAGELLTVAASRALRTPDSPTVESLVYVPVAAGAALGYRAARGSFGREKPLVRAPLVVVSARF